MEMRILQEMDIKQYQEQGYLIVENLISDEEIKQLRQRTEDIIAGHILNILLRLLNWNQVQIE